MSFPRLPKILGLKRSELAALVAVVLMGAIQLACFALTEKYVGEGSAAREQNAGIRIVQQALVDAEEGVTDYILTTDPSHLPRYYQALGLLGREGGTLAPLAGLKAQKGSSIDTAYQDLRAAWNRCIELIAQGKADEAARLSTSLVHARMDYLRSAMRDSIAANRRQARTADEQVQLLNVLDLTLQLAAAVLVVILLLAAFRSNRAQSERRREAIDRSVSANSQLTELFQMTDMLQSAMSHADANAVLNATIHGLMPGLGSALFVFNNSRDRLELSTAWNLPSSYKPAQHIVPGDCWALKRGKHHFNAAGVGMLTCAHRPVSDCSALEIPMMARGEVFGLLEIVVPETYSAMDRAEIQRIATPIAEAMSLALANISLREKLRNQALRDPLTGLYNRRYMEEMLERFAELSSRSARPLAVIMIDLDNFKILNDQHGHGTGDSVLREVAAVIRGGLRQSDIACRYGGEEILVLLPDSEAADAERRAEALRARIESLSDSLGVRVTASFGVAAIPHSTAQAKELVALADAALYRAKELGRNRVAVATAIEEGVCIGVAAE